MVLSACLVHELQVQRISGRSVGRYKRGLTPFSIDTGASRFAMARDTLLTPHP